MRGRASPEEVAAVLTLLLTRRRTSAAAASPAGAAAPESSWSRPFSRNRVGHAPDEGWFASTRPWT
ncbi:acyl-CoA carboxylase epsilon subunit [Kineococcus sp. SYSU DK003]|uniref:acyl-CoA carboxylase epsilon subunit n=1 Tax=Kineococcus sp. SYSU DK003 TaxID=3383124 RepID=UPI003D7D5B29